MLTQDTVEGEQVTLAFSPETRTGCQCRPGLTVLRDGAQANEPQMPGTEHPPHPTPGACAPPRLSEDIQQCVYVLAQVLDTGFCQE